MYFRRVRMIALLAVCTVGCATVHPEPGPRPGPTNPQAQANQHRAAMKHYEKAERFAAQGKWAPAEAQYRAALKQDPHFALAHGHLGYVLVELGHLDHAIEAYREAIRLDPDYSDALIRIAETLHEVGHFAEAWEYLHKAEKLGHTAPKLRKALTAKHPEPGKSGSAPGKSKRAGQGKPGKGNTKGKGKGLGDWWPF